MNKYDGKSKLIDALIDLVAAEKGQIYAALKLGISPSYLSDVLSGRREPGKRLLLALKFKRVVTYEPE
jgi:hypothetical protein